MHRMTVRFEGRVQGVGFRMTVAELARALPVTGWVCNVSDGSVRMVAEGDQTALDALHTVIKQRMARNIVSEQVAWEAVESSSWDVFSIVADQIR